MTFKSYRELVCWQLSVQLRNEIIEIIERPLVARHYRFGEQVSASARLAVSSIAEGFGRSNKEFHRYLQIALGSLQETENHLAKGAHQAALGLSQYLKRRIQKSARQ